MQITYKNLAIYTLYAYILSLYVFAHDVRLNIISKVLFIAVLATFVIYICKHKMVEGGSIYIFAFAFSLYITISSFWSIDMSYSFSKNITVYQVIILMLIVYNLLSTRKDLDNIIMCLFWGGIIMCIYTVIYYGPETIAYCILNGIRVGGEINQENIFGEYCTVSYAIGLSKVVLDKKKLYIFPTLLALLFSFTSGSRRSILVVIIISGILIALKDGKFKVYKLIIYASIFFCIIYLVSKIDVFENLFVRFTSLLDSVVEGKEVKESSYDIRKNLIRFGIDKFKNNPLFGYGTNQFDVLYKIQYGKAKPAHNNYIDLLVNHGLIGFFIYYSGIIAKLKDLLNGCKRADKTAINAFLIICVELIGQVATVSIGKKFTYIYIAIIYAYYNIVKKEKSNKL